MRKASVTIYWDKQSEPEGWAFKIHNSERFDSGPLDIEGEDVGKREAFDAFLSEVPSWYAEEDLPAYEDFQSLTHDGPGWEARGAK